MNARRIVPFLFLAACSPCEVESILIPWNELPSDPEEQIAFWEDKIEANGWTIKREAFDAVFSGQALPAPQVVRLNLNNPWVTPGTEEYDPKVHAAVLSHEWEHTEQYKTADRSCFDKCEDRWQLIEEPAYIQEIHALTAFGHEEPTEWISEFAIHSALYATEIDKCADPNEFIAEILNITEELKEKGEVDGE